MEADLPPEYCHYRDEGCEFAPSCLDCPLPHCIEDIPRGKQRLRKEFRDRAILNSFLAEGISIKQLATKFGLSKRTVQRVLSKASSLSQP